MKIAIQSPPFHTASGGIRVLHFLGHLAHTLGHEVDMRSNVLNSIWPVYSMPIEKPDLWIIPEIHPATVATDGNVVRWVLFFPGRLAGPKYYPNHEMVWSFADDYLDETEKAAGHKCNTFFLPFCDFPHIDETITKDLLGVCWQGKGPRVPWPEGLEQYEIRRDWPTERQALIRLLMRAERLYSCDRFTALNQEALLCGCEVFVWNGNDWQRFDDTNASTYIVNENDALSRVDKFLKECAKHFGLQEGI